MFLVLLLFWIIFNGKITVEILVIGALISLAVYLFLCMFMGYSPKKDARAALKIFKAIKYGAVLVVEIIKANCQVIWFIYNQKIEPEPVMVKFRKTFKSHYSNEVLANSITLTPGTITVDLDDDRYTVHCLDKDLSEGLDSSVFVKQLEAAEKVDVKKISRKVGRKK